MRVSERIVMQTRGLELGTRLALLLPMSRELLVGEVMTQLPNGIGVDQSISTAEARMRRLELRHLPVFDEGALVGVLSDGDILMVSGISQLDIKRTSVGEIMTAEPYCVELGTPVHTVARELATRKIGSAIVTEGGQMVGIVTTTDLLRSFAELLLFGDGRDTDKLGPEHIRTRMLRETQSLRRLLQSVQALLDRAQSSDEEVRVELRTKTRDLHQALVAHLDREDKLLAPALREGDGFAEVREQSLLSEHRMQRKRLAESLENSDSFSANELIEALQRWIPTALADLEREEQNVLTEANLSDTPRIADTFGG